MQNLKNLALIAGEKSVMDFMRKKEKWTNKGNDKQLDADSPLHITTSQTLCLYKFSSLKVAKKTDTNLPTPYTWVTDEKWKKKAKEITVSCFSFT